MLHVLSKEESFAWMNRNFDAMAAHDVIDLTHDNKRYPAIVFNVYKSMRAFDVLPLTTENIEYLVYPRIEGNLDLVNRLVIVNLPNSADEVHPMWNKMQRT